MQTEDLIKTLGYADSSHFLRPGDFARAPEHAHLFQRASETCGVRGVYLLRRDVASDSEASAPAVYVAEARTEQEAEQFHRQVWNQNVVPFLLVRTPTDVRLYSGFEYRPATTSSEEQRGVLEASIGFGEVLERLKDLRAEAIDDGTVWRTIGQRIDPARRVDTTLLENLKKLGQWLRSGADKLSRPVAHALIGKFVYLHYLKDRGILSPRKFERLGVDRNAAFSRNATVEGVRALVEAVDVKWLNGSIFPFPFSGENAPKAAHVRRVAGVFEGDDPESGQMHLDFRAYDFSFIPVETLSVVYEQFLSVEGANKEKGAFYTPVHLVNFMLAELDGMHTIEPGTKVLDPSCGSGAFLVQCYRRIVARHLARGGKRRPSDLRHLLVSSIFGVDRDEDACQVTALSLILAMLDYVDPPDLESTPQFKLPNLVGQNVFVGDFFDTDPAWARRRYDLVVGNPPWIQSEKSADTPARRWMDAHAKTQPVTNNDVAEAFAWKAMEHVSLDGAVGLLLPAMTLFKDSTAFRARYFSEVDVAVVANFTNLRRDLFHKAETPAAALFAWGSRSRDGRAHDPVVVFSPLVANQPTNRTEEGSRHEPWVLTIDSSEVQHVPRDRITDGDMLPWKVAMWGGPRDLHLLRSMRDLPTLDAFVDKHGLAISKGLDGTSDKSSAVVPVPEIAGKQKLQLAELKCSDRIYEFPPTAFEPIPKEKALARVRGGLGPLRVCRPPHVIVGQARTFATFSSEYIVVPSPHVGIAGNQNQTVLLKALALYLNADFVAYHQSLVSAAAEFRGGHSTLRRLRELPVPLDSLTAAEVNAWAALYDGLAATQRKLWAAKERADTPRRVVEVAPLELRLAELEAEANELVTKALGLKDEERVLVRDFIHVRWRLADGLVPKEAVRRPEKKDLDTYARRLAKTLDRAIDESETRRHDVRVVADEASGMVGIELAPAKAGKVRRVFEASDEVGTAFAKIRRRMTRERGQWLYFDRNLFLFHGRRTLILKPLQRLWWTEAQALADADHLVAVALSPGEGDR